MNNTIEKLVARANSALPHKLLLFLLSASTSGVTLMINPWTNFDPINIPKMFLLVITAVPLFIFSIYQHKPKWRGNSFPLICVLILCTGFILPITFSGTSIQQQIFGIWGRSTGVLSLVSLALITVSCIALASDGSLKFLLLVFSRTSYLVTAYVILQHMQLDPIKWSQQLPIGTLGNINFVSSFLGMVNTYFISRVLQEKLSFAPKLHYIFFISLNSYLIWISGSIQGLAMLGGGVVIALYIKFKSIYSSRVPEFFLGMSLLSGFVIFVGSMGVGPLGSYLYQDTVAYRTDYWRAGFAMFLSNPVTGVGVDSYGDFYREFRDREAAIRTGPQRVTDTAHNVFLDYLSGGGAVVGFAFLVLVIGTLVMSVRIGTSKSHMVTLKHLGPIVTSWIIFLAISINQIGVTVWGFAVSGMVWGLKNKFQEPVFPKLEKRNGVLPPRQSEDSSELFKFKGVRSLVILVMWCKKFILYPLFALMSLVFVCMATLPMRADISFLQASRSSSVGPIAATAFAEIGYADFHREKVIELLRREGKDASALFWSKELVKIDNRNFYAWAAILESEESSESDKANAAKQLFSLDPNNSFLLEQFGDLINS